MNISQIEQATETLGNNEAKILYVSMNQYEKVRWLLASMMKSGEIEDIELSAWDRFEKMQSQQDIPYKITEAIYPNAN